MYLDGGRKCQEVDTLHRGLITILSHANELLWSKIIQFLWLTLLLILLKDQ